MIDSKLSSVAPRHDQYVMTSIMSTIREHLVQCQNKKHVVIDFSAVNQFLLNSLSSHDCVYSIFNLQKKISSQLDSTNRVESDRLELELTKVDIDRLLHACRHGNISMIFTWDLLNYLSQKSIMHIMSKIIPFCSSDTLLHSLLWTNQLLPFRPEHFEISENWELLYFASQSNFHQMNSYSAQKIRSMIPSFDIMRVTASTSGLQDALFQFNQITDAPNPELITIPSHYPFYKPSSN